MTARTAAATPLPEPLMPPGHRPCGATRRGASRKNKLAVGALVVMVLLILIAIFADVIAPAPYDYSVLAEANQFPNRQHLLGTDTVGRDFLSRLIYGTRVSLIVGFSVQAIALLIGVTLGHAGRHARRLGRLRHHALGRGADGHPDLVVRAVPDLGLARFRLGARQRAAQRDRGDRADRLGRYLPPDARPAAVAARERVRAGRLRRSARPGCTSRCTTCCPTP